MLDSEPIVDQKSRALELRYHQLQDVFNRYLTLDDSQRDLAYEPVMEFIDRFVDEDLIRYIAEHGTYSLQLRRNVGLALTEKAWVDDDDNPGFQKSIPKYDGEAPYVVAKISADGTIEGIAHNIDAENDLELRAIYGRAALQKALSPEHLRHAGIVGGIRVPENGRKLKSIGYGRHNGSNERPVVHYHGGASMGSSGRVGNPNFIESVVLGRPMKSEWEEAGLIDTMLSDSVAYASSHGDAQSFDYFDKEVIWSLRKRNPFTQEMDQ